MFGIKKKVYYIFALVLGIIGIIILGLKVFNVLPNEAIVTLVALIFLMLGFVLYIRPNVKILNLKMSLCDQYRNDFYNELMKDNKYETELSFFENEDHQLQYKKFIFNGLSIDEAQVISVLLLNDYVRIVFGVMDEKKKKFIKATIEKFSIVIKRTDNKVLYKDFIKNYNFVK